MEADNGARNGLEGEDEPERTVREFVVYTDGGGMQRNARGTLIWTPKEGEWRIKAAWAFTILEIVDGQVDWLRDMVGPVVVPGAPEYLQGAAIGCTGANAENGELSGLAYAIVYMKEMLVGMENVEVRIQFRCDCLNAIKKISGSMVGRANLDVIRQAREKLGELRQKAVVRFDKVDEQHSGKGAVDIWQNHVDCRCTEAMKGAMTKWAFLDSVGELMASGLMWDLGKEGLRKDPPMWNEGALELEVAAAKDAEDPKRVGAAYRLWHRGILVSAEVDVLQPGDMGISAGNRMEAGIAQAMIMGLTCVVKMVAEDNVMKFKKVVVGKGSKVIRRYLGIGDGDVPVSSRKLVADRWYEIRGLAQTLHEEEVVVEAANEEYVKETDVVFVMAKLQVYRRQNLWREPKVCAWTEGHKQLPLLPAQWPIECPYGGCTRKIEATGTSVGMKWLLHWNTAHLGDGTPELVRALAPAACVHCKKRFKKSMLTSGMEAHAHGCPQNPENWSCREQESQGVEIVRSQDGGMGVKYPDDDGNAAGNEVQEELAEWKYSAMENVDWNVVCRFKGRMVQEVPRVFAKLWRKTLEALAEDAMTESNERRIHVVALFKMKDALVWRHTQEKGGWKKIQRKRILDLKQGHAALKTLVEEYLRERESMDDGDRVRWRPQPAVKSDRDVKSHCLKQMGIGESQKAMKVLRNVPKFSGRVEDLWKFFPDKHADLVDPGGRDCPLPAASPKFVAECVRKQGRGQAMSLDGSKMDFLKRAHDVAESR
jgi:hypothetical protein